MDTKDKISVWGGIFTLAVLVAEDRIAAELTYSTDSFSALVTIVGSLVGYVVGFVIVYSVIKWLLERYFKGRSLPQSTAPPPFGPP